MTGSAPTLKRKTSEVTEEQVLPRRAEAERVSRELDGYCESLSVGDRVPPHTELMRQFNASERSVLNALADLQRRGRIVRRHRAGTFIAEGQPASSSTNRTAVDSRTIIVISRPDHSFFDYAIEMMHGYALNAGMRIVCHPVISDEELIADEDALGKPLGIIVFQRRLAPLAKHLLENGHRVVSIGSPLAGITPVVPTICGDGELGGFLAGEHLIALGHRRIAFFDEGELVEQTTRYRGLLRAIDSSLRKGVPVQHCIVPMQSKEWLENRDLATAYFGRPDAPTAVICWNDKFASLLYSILHRAGISVPGDVSIIGYDAMPLGAYLNPPLTTVDHFLERQLKHALDILTRPDPPSPNFLTMTIPVLIERESTAPPKSFRPNRGEQ